MNRKTASQLTLLLKAKTQLERFQYEDIKKQHSAAIQNAAALHEEAIRSSPVEHKDGNAAVYQLNEKHVSHLLKNSKTEQSRADSMLDALNENLSNVKNALQRELALKEMSKKLETEYRAIRNKQEESQHEHVRSLKPIKQRT